MSDNPARTILIVDDEAININFLNFIYIIFIFPCFILLKYEENSVFLKSDGG